jgi:hypothetical protein
LHAFTQLPQWLRSLVVFAQLEPQSVKPVLHTHAPELHVPPTPQLLPHIPQFVAFVSRFTHVPLQSVVPPGQLHVPPTHVIPI